MSKNLLSNSFEKRRTLPIKFYRSGDSLIFNKSLFRKLVSRQLSNPVLDDIESKRKVITKYSADVNLNVEKYLSDNVVLKNNIVSAQEISLPAIYGHVLYSLTAFIKPKIILEAGTGLGISCMFLASACSSNNGNVISFEISNSSKLAQSFINSLCSNVIVVNDDFSVFSAYLNVKKNIDMVYLDAAHSKDALTRYTKNIKGWLKDSSVVIIDDVSYDKNSYEFWKRYSRHEDVKFSALINDRLGFVSFQ